MRDLTDDVRQIGEGEIVEGELSDEEKEARRTMESHWAFLRNKKDKSRWKKIRKRAWELYLERLRMRKKE